VLCVLGCALLATPTSYGVNTLLSILCGLMCRCRLAKQRASLFWVRPELYHVLCRISGILFSLFFSVCWFYGGCM
jgi:hypothetical protein